jgi:hypothetical protein
MIFAVTAACHDVSSIFIPLGFGNRFSKFVSAKLGLL